MIKKYIEFISIIKENNSLDIEDIFLSDEDINVFFYELLDYGWIINIDKGIFLRRDDYHGDTGARNEFEFSDVLYSGSSNKGYKIEIIPNKMSKNSEDSTFSFRSSVLRFASFTNSNYYIIPNHFLQIDDEKVLLKDIELKDSEIIIKDSTFDRYQSLSIYIFSKEKIEITDILVANYHNWSYDDSDNKGNIYVVYDSLIKLVKLFLSETDRNYELLTNPESIYDYYWSSDYEPDIDSLFRYYLNKENTNKILEKLIEDNGGYEEVITIFDDEYEKEQLYSFLLKNPNKLKKLDNVDLLDEIRSLCSSYLRDAHIDENIKDIEDSFIKELNKTVDLTIIEQEDKTLYKIKFNKDWYIDRSYDYNDLTQFKHIADLMYEWIYHDGMQFTINPYFSDHGDMDKQEFNREVNGYFK